MSARPLLQAATHPHKHVMERATSYLAIIDQWASRRGLTDVVREKTGGGGKVAVVAALAAKSMESSHKVHPQGHYLRQSGLSPSAFQAAMKYLQQAIDDDKEASKAKASASTSVSDTPRTPSTRGGASSSSSATSSAVASPSTPTSLKERAMAVQSGQAFRLSPQAGLPRTPPSRRSARASGSGSGSRTPITPRSHSHSRSDTEQSTPKSVRFSEQPSSDHGQHSPSDGHRNLTPRAAAAGKNVTNSYEHPYTPSKRSRLGRSEQPPSSSRSGSGKRRRVDDQDEYEEEEEEEPLVAGPTPTTGSARKRMRAARQTTKAEQLLDVILFPLDQVYMDKVRGRAATKRGKIDVKKWLQEWASWLDESSASEGSE